ncbi:MAG TPA: hypothetical protein VEW25_02970 [Allosphingosinicella sp.]|nr:hypothetical protein [Allosphingosinicella sp.]
MTYGREDDEGGDSGMTAPTNADEAQAMSDAIQDEIREENASDDE